MPETLESVDEAVGEALLEALASRREVADDVARRGTVLDEHTETIGIKQHERLFVTESRKRRKMPASAYRSKRRGRNTLADRWSGAPSGFNSIDANYISEETPTPCEGCDGSGRRPCSTCHGEKTETCPECSGDRIVDCHRCGGEGENPCDTCGGDGSVQKTREQSRPCEQCGGNMRIKCPECLGDDEDCSNCRGKGVVDCPTCGGRGTQTETEAYTEQCSTCFGEGATTCESCDGEQTETCSNCGGDGSITCRNCDGKGDIQCSTCEGDGKTVTATVGTLSFERSTNLEVDADHVPARAIQSGDGRVVETTRPVNDERVSETVSGMHLFRHEITQSRADCETAEYTYDGDRYWVARVDGELRYEDFPNDPEHLEESIAQAKSNGTFELRPRTSAVGALATSVKRLLTDAGKFLVASGLLLVVLFAVSIVSAIVGVVSSTVSSALFVLLGGAGSIIVAYAFFELLWGDRESNLADFGPDRTYSRWDLLLPALLVAAAGATFAASVGDEFTRLRVSTVALGLWAGRVGTWLDYEGHRVSYVLEQRTKLISRLSADEATLSKFGLESELPSPSRTLSRSTYTRLGVVVFTLCWGGCAAVFAALFVSGFAGISVVDASAALRPFLLAVGAVSTLGFLVGALPRLLD